MIAIAHRPELRQLVNCVNMAVITLTAAHIKLVICMNMADIIPRPEHREQHG